jgi:hypothetical protein
MRALVSPALRYSLRLPSPASWTCRESRRGATRFAPPCDALVFAELQLGCDAQSEVAGNARPQVGAVLVRPSNVACFSASLPITLTKTFA